MGQARPLPHSHRARAPVWQDNRDPQAGLPLTSTWPHPGATGAFRSHREVSRQFAAKLKLPARDRLEMMRLGDAGLAFHEQVASLVPPSGRQSPAGVFCFPGRGAEPSMAQKKRPRGCPGAWAEDPLGRGKELRWESGGVVPLFSLARSRVIKPAGRHESIAVEGCAWDS